MIFKQWPTSSIGEPNPTLPEVQPGEAYVGRALLDGVLACAGGRGRSGEVDVPHVGAVPRHRPAAADLGEEAAGAETWNAGLIGVDCLLVGCFTGSIYCQFLTAHNTIMSDWFRNSSKYSIQQL